MPSPSPAPPTKSLPPHGRHGKIAVEALPPLAGSPGLAGAFAGVIGNHLLAGGGANFPDGIMPWHGGKKVWHDSLHALDLSATAMGWKTIGKLPKPNGYGVSLTAPEGILLLGGGDAVAHHRDALLLSLTNAGSPRFEPLPGLPVPLAHMSGALVGRHVHLCGGIETPAATMATQAHWMLDLAHPGRGWQAQPDLPAPGRILAMAAAVDDAFFLMGGCALAPDAEGNAARTWLKDAWRFSAGRWSRLSDLPHPLAAAGSPAPVAGGSVFLVSGDDGSQTGLASPDQHAGFSGEILRYDTRADQWSSAGELDGPAPVTLPVVPWHDEFLFFNGEIKPGLRTPRVFVFAPRSFI